jgi:hypothetical protein
MPDSLLLLFLLSHDIRSSQYKSRRQSKLVLSHFLCTAPPAPPHDSFLVKPSAPELPHAIRLGEPNDPKPIYWRPYKLTVDQEDELEKQRADLKQDLEDEQADFEKSLEKIDEEIKELKEKRDRELEEFDAEHPQSQAVVANDNNGSEATMDVDAGSNAPEAAKPEDESMPEPA